MNVGQMIVVLLLLSLLVFAYANAMGYELTYMEALAGLAVLKGIALFLTPEKPPMVFMRSEAKEEDA